MSNLTTATQARLKAREDRLEARANMRLNRVKEKINYLKSNSGSIIVDEALDNLSQSSPVMAKVARFVSGLVTKSRNKRVAKELTQEQTLSHPTSSYSTRDGESQSSLLSTVKSYLLPTLYSLGGMQLLSYSLKGSGKVLRSGLGRLFRWRRKRG